VITFCPKPGLVRSTAGNVWTHLNSFTIRLGSPWSAGCKLPGRTRAYTVTVWTRLKPRSHCPRFQSRRRYGVVTGTHLYHTVATPASTVLNRDTPCWTGVHREVTPVVSIFLKQPGLTGTHRAAKQRRLIPGHYRSSSGMNRISTVTPPGKTVANLHGLCPRWRLPAWPRCVTEESRRSLDSCRSNYGVLNE